LGKGKGRAAARFPSKPTGQQRVDKRLKRSRDPLGLKPKRVREAPPLLPLREKLALCSGVLPPLAKDFGLVFYFQLTSAPSNFFPKFLSISTFPLILNLKIHDNGYLAMEKKSPCSVRGEPLIHGCGC
jgi:hypothetical protein